MSILIEGLNKDRGSCSFLAIDEEGYVWDAFGREGKKYKVEYVDDCHGNLVDENKLVEILKRELIEHGAKKETIERKVNDLKYLIAMAGYVIGERSIGTNDYLTPWYDHVMYDF